MGYWDKHPMSGDLPMDAEYDLRDLLFTEEEMERDLHYDETFYKKRLEEKLQEASQLKFLCDQHFILPFKVAEMGIVTSNEVLSKKIQKMIGDGGAAERGYPLDESNEQNNYNNFESPYDYARYLYDHWERGMKGEVDLKPVGRGIGLFEKLSNHLTEGNGGLMNTD